MFFKIPFYPVERSIIKYIYLYVYIYALFFSAIVSTLKQVPVDLLDKVSTEPQMVRTIAFGLGVIQGMLVARQLFGAQGLNQWYPFNRVQMEQALFALTGKMLKTEDQQAPKVDTMAEIFAKVSWLIFMTIIIVRENIL